MTSQTPPDPQSAATGIDVDRIVAAAHDQFPAAVSDLGELVRIPGIAWPAFDQEQLRLSGKRIAELADETGLFDTVRVLDAQIPGTDERGQPAVLATRAARNGKPTVMLYAHHDVQPPGDEALWQTPPFEPTVRSGRLYGRGSADDKAGVMVHIAALRTLKDLAGDDLEVGIVLFIEGEEEYGSRSFSQFLADNHETMASDVIVVADSGNWDEHTPAVTVSLRGNVKFHLTVRTLAHASHSGMFGGAVPDAMLATIKLLSTLWRADGGVAVDGLAVREGATPEYGEETLRDEAGLLEGVSPIGEGEVLSRIWNKPAITVTGIDHTSVAAASNTLSPEVTVVVSARVAPGQSSHDAYDAIRAHLEANTPFGAHLAYSEVDFGDGFLVDTDGRAVALLRTALAEGYGTEPIDYGIGGSIPFIADLVEKNPGAQILVTGIEDPHTRAHSPNESLHLETFRRAIASEALLLARIDAGSAV